MESELGESKKIQEIRKPEGRLQEDASDVKAVNSVALGGLTTVRGPEMEECS